MTTDTEELTKAIAEFESSLPGWWWSVGHCSVSRDASCGPDRNGPDAYLLNDRLFDNGFHYDGEGSLADSLREVMREALAEKAKEIQLQR